MLENLSTSPCSQMDITHKSAKWWRDDAVTKDNAGSSLSPNKFS